MARVIDLAQSPEQREAICKLRYTVYPEEMHLFCSIADTARGLLKDRDDDSARLVYTWRSTGKWRAPCVCTSAATPGFR